MSAPTVAVNIVAVLVLASAAACGEDEAGSPDPSSLEQVPWLVVSGLEVEGWEDAAPSANFEGGRIAGSTGCNRFTAPYTVDSDALELDPIVATKMACPPRPTRLSASSSPCSSV